MPLQGIASIEICVDNIDAAFAAQNAGANRIELSTSLNEGGITPFFSLLEKVCSSLKIPVNVMIRPRAGDFLYSDSEFELMKFDIEQALKSGAEGIVFGILKEDGTIDRKRCETLIELARPMKITFHRAFDMTADPFIAMEEIISIGCNYILTSGQHQTAEDGLETIRELVKRSLKRISIVAAGGITHSNCLLLYEAGVREFHFTANKISQGKMKFRNELLKSMGQSNSVSEYENSEFDKQKVTDIMNMLRSMKL